MATTTTDDKKRSYYDCSKCPAYCCSIYDRVQVNKRDLTRLAKHFGISEEAAAQQHTKMYQKERILRRKKDPIFGLACKLSTRNRAAAITMGARGLSHFSRQSPLCLLRSAPVRAKLAGRPNGGSGGANHFS
jgi:hypothetical protein